MTLTPKVPLDNKYKVSIEWQKTQGTTNVEATRIEITTEQLSAASETGSPTSENGQVAITTNC